MKTIGLIGGLTWVSSIDYYRYFNQEVNKKLGGDEAARVILNSVNYGEIKRLTLSGNWPAIAELILHAAIETEKAGAECILLGANTMHHVADIIQNGLQVPLIHIADATADAIKEKNLKTVALIGTRYTMEFEFFKKRLRDNGIQTLIPDEKGIETINFSIYNELGKNIFLESTKQQFINIINELVAKGAEGVILGCTEIPLLIKQEDSPAPIFDTTFIHAKAAVEFALND